jgi:hypothetical protein
MLISMPTGISTIFGAFQDILELLAISVRNCRMAEPATIEDSDHARSPGIR